MTPLNQVTNIVAFAKKIFTYENGALLFLAAIPSEIFTRIFTIIFDGVPLKTIWMPFVVASVALGSYFIVFMVDFATGINASRREINRDGLKFRPSSGKLWSSFWKLFVINVLICFQIPFALVFGAMGLETIHTIFLFVMILLSIAASLFDMISIGENYKRSYDKKPKVFELIERVSSAVNEGIIQKVKNLF
jgi:hypothetical protein